MDIDAGFDGGSIEVARVSKSGSVELLIPPDNAAPFRQWFCFRVRSGSKRPRSLALINAGQATFPSAFDGYAVMASTDQRTWRRMPTVFDGERLEFLHVPRGKEVTYAYFAPYPLERHEALLARAASAPWGRVESLGQTTQGRSLDLVVLGEQGREKHQIWVTARQHPGETMAEWFMEGLVERLLDDDDEVTRRLLDQAVFYLVPNMNPDGSFLGNLRTNAAGLDLNRSWDDPDDERGPEVAWVRERMHRDGVDLFLDIHGDERNPYCFLVGCEGNPGYTERLRELENLFEQSLCLANPEFQDEYGYPRDEPGAGDLSCASNYVGETFDCLAFTLEMPFKDNAIAPEPRTGWSPERSAQLGASTLESVAVCLDDLRLGDALAAAAQGGVKAAGARGPGAGRSACRRRRRSARWAAGRRPRAAGACPRW